MKKPDPKHPARSLSVIQRQDRRPRVNHTAALREKKRRAAISEEQKVLKTVADAKAAARAQAEAQVAAQKAKLEEVAPAAVEPEPVVDEVKPEPVVDEVKPEPEPVVEPEVKLESSDDEKVTDEQIAELLSGNNREINAGLETGAFDSALDRVEAAEKAGKARKGALRAVEARRNPEE